LGQRVVAEVRPKDVPRHRLFDGDEDLDGLAGHHVELNVDVALM